MAESEEEDQYQSDGDHWSEGEESQIYTDEEADYEAPPWPGDGYSSSGIGEESDVEESELDPPQDRDDSELEDSAHGEEDQTIEPYQRPWCEITDSEISSRDGDHVDDDHWSLETEPEDTSVEESKFEEENQESNGEDINYTKQDEIDDAPTEDEADCEPYYICFSGHKQGPEAYLRWERDMESWFQTNNIPEEEKTTYAEDTLTEGAYQRWDQEETWRCRFDEPASTWEEMKKVLHEEFVDDVSGHQYNLQFDNNPRPRRWILATMPNPKDKLKRTGCPEPNKVFHNTLEKKTEVKKPVGVKEFKPAPKQTDASQTPSTQPKQEPRVKTEQCKSSKALKINDTICYRCHKRGHFAAVCPERQEIKIAKPEPKLNSLDSCLENSSFKFLNSDLMHLSFPKATNAGQGQNVEHHEATMSCLDAEKDGGDTSFILVQEEPPDYMLNTKTVAMKETELKDSPAQVSPSLQFVSNEYNSVMVYFTNTEEYEEDLVSKETYSDQIAQLKICFNGKLEKMLQTEFCFSVYKNSMTVIMHLSLVKILENISGTEKKQQESNPQKTNGDKNSEKGDFTRSNVLLPKDVSQQPWRGIIASLLIKEEPPDAQLKPYQNSNDNIAQGKFLASKLRMKPNLLSLGAGVQVLRTKLFEEGGYDAVIKPTTSHGRDHMEQRQADKTEKSKSTLRGPSQSQVKKELEPRTNIGVPQVMMRRIKTSLRTVLFFLHCGFIPMGFPGKVLTRQQLIGAQETKANCSSLTTTWITSSSQLENTSKWNQPSIRSHEGDIKFTSHVNPDLTCLDLRALFEGFRSNHKELSYKSTWYVFLIHQRSSGNWIRTKPKSDEKVIQFLNRWILLLPYLAPYGFMGLQTYQWRPGDLNTDLEASLKVLQCSNTQRIRRILSHFHFPYPKPSLPYLPCLEPKEINQQRLFLSSLVCILKSYTMNLDVPRHHQFAPKLSRLKAPHNLPYLDRFCLYCFNSSFHLFCAISFVFLAYYRFH